MFFQITVYLPEPDFVLFFMQQTLPKMRSSHTKTASRLVSYKNVSHNMISPQIDKGNICKTWIEKLFSLCVR